MDTLLNALIITLACLVYAGLCAIGVLVCMTSYNLARMAKQIPEENR